MTEDRVGTVYLVGAGPGDPGLITRRGWALLRRAEVVVYDRLANPALLLAAPPTAELVDVGKRVGEGGRTQEEINALLIALAQEGKQVVRLKGGDPFLFGRGGEEATALAAARIPFVVVPGVSSALAVPATAGIPVTERRYASSVAIVTGHDVRGKPTLATAETLVFLMGMENLARIVASLQEQGWPATTPVAVIQRGTTARQRVLVSTLGEVVAGSRAAALVPPAVVVVGEVVRLRERLAWWEAQPLAGVRVIITRPRPLAEPLAELVAERGGEPVIWPLLTVVPPEDPTPLQKAIKALSLFTWALFTSANGVRFFWEALLAQGKDSRALAGLKIGAVGPATAAALAEVGIRPDLVPEEALTRALGEALIAKGKGSLAGEHFLLPRAAEASPTLPELLRGAGAQVTEVVAYHTRPVSSPRIPLAQFLPPADGRGYSEGFPAGGNHKGRTIITLTSPSCVRSFYQTLAQEGLNPAGVCRQAALACIGPETAQAVRKLGLPVALVASEHTAAGLVAAIEVWTSSLRA